MLLLALTASGQTRQDTARFRIMSYNVENLFDSRHDTLKEDREFLPDAIRHWNYTKYRKKLNDIARVITAVGQWEAPALVALCEVENDTVIRDLTRYSALREAGYRYLMTHSPDLRGIDVALLYQRHLFKPIAHRSISVPPPGKDSRPTRDILHVSGLLLNLDTLDVFVCHFPSRSEGARETEPYRLRAARLVRQAADSLLHVRQRPQILIMGDFNDYPHNKSIRQVLGAQLLPENTSENADSSVVAAQPDPYGLYHLLAHQAAHRKHFGSYKYRGEWGLLDHIIVSGTLLLPDAPCHTRGGDVFAPDFLLAPDKKYGDRQPFRTYYGMKYQGGYSDHLPVWADFYVLY
ncbi:endonuclease/exonuclease/phosphatase family protein [Bacteroides sp.]|uniref:endonuclease/exonuclease/phosphatase family protein n=1 Tax=Bacteroides sp. TaxID=29523 RepID=UPI002583768F|nr:endonuclease/exonuclease/phosphatase family protein [Bacteroides sp.]